MTIHSSLFKAALARFCSGIAVVTALTPDGVRGMTVTAFSSLSLTPPLILVCVANNGRMNRALATSLRFGVSILAEDQAEISSFYAGKGVRDKIPATEALGEAMVVTGAIAQLDCSLASRHEGGDHTIYVGRVEQCRMAEGAPLLYFCGDYRALQER
jgi:flavin reductase (DIM6/NTAB) family NADH-FMN oxidoreductase RutF